MKATKEIRQKILEYRDQEIKAAAIVVRIKKEFKVKLCIATIFNVCKKRKSQLTHKIVSRSSPNLRRESLDELYDKIMKEIENLRENFADKMKSIRLELIKSRVEAKQNMKFQKLIDT